jgi:uncharacterized radical SAM superfamily Fe-S cluster-containing enzyme
MEEIAETNTKILDQIESVCPICLMRIPADRIMKDDNVVLAKKCPEHGRFETIIWRGSPSMDGWKRFRKPFRYYADNSNRNLGCPFESGTCHEYERTPCSVVFEVTSRCYQNCPVCLTNSTPQGYPNPDTETIKLWFQKVREAVGFCNIQLSGGEPTIRDDLPSIIETGCNAGFSNIQLNTNGTRLAADAGYAFSLKRAGLSTVLLQFDGFHDRYYLFLRGKPLLEEKLLAIEHCENAGLSVILVATLVQAINIRGIGSLIFGAVQMDPVVKGVHLQPISCFGRYPPGFEKAGRITLSEVMQCLEKQTNGRVTIKHLSLSKCKHRGCSFHGTFFRMPGGDLRPASGIRNLSSYLNYSMKKKGQFMNPNLDFFPSSLNDPMLPDGRNRIVGIGKPLLDDPFLLNISDPDWPPEKLDSRRFTISCTAYQDAWNIELEKPNGCCTAIITPDGRLVPFCEYNLTAQTGQKLYRDAAAWC